ncbi:MAG: hypothetical protein ACO32I_07885 [Candidatus Limnocylindrus sp.]
MENKTENLVRLLEQAYTAALDAIPELRNLGVDVDAMKHNLGEMRTDLLTAQLAAAIEKRRRERVESGESR